MSPLNACRLTYSGGIFTQRPFRGSWSCVHKRNRDMVRYSIYPKGKEGEGGLVAPRGNATDTVPGLLPMAMDPATLPVADGVNTTLRATVCPGANVVLAPAPLAANPAPFTSTLEIVTFAFPVLVSVAPSELLVPSNTLPKSRLFVLELNSGVDATELALVEIVTGEFGALLTRNIT